LVATGLSAARGDELADLRANQELLQRRVDQLAQVPPPGAGPGGPVLAGRPWQRQRHGRRRARQLQ